MNKVNEVQIHEFSYLIERNLKAACDSEDTETKKKHILRAMQLMELDEKRRLSDSVVIGCHWCGKNTKFGGELYTGNGVLAHDFCIAKHGDNINATKDN